jgi:hypothetical protein
MARAVLSASLASSPSPPVPPRPSGRPPSLPIVPLRRTRPEQYPTSPFRSSNIHATIAIASDAPSPRNAPSPSKQPQTMPLRQARLRKRRSHVPSGLGKNLWFRSPANRFRSRHLAAGARFLCRAFWAPPSYFDSLQKQPSPSAPLPRSLLAPLRRGGARIGDDGKGVGPGYVLLYSRTLAPLARWGRGSPRRAEPASTSMWLHASSPTTTTA